MKKFIPSSVAAFALAAAVSLATPGLAQDTSETAPLSSSPEQQYESLKKRIADAEKSGNQSPKKDGPNVDLPGDFYKAVRGCTTDGYIYRITYNLTVNFDELAAPSAPGTPLHERSLLERLVQPDPDSVLGVSGTDRFVQELKEMTSEIHNAMDVVTGRLIDEAPSAFLQQPVFNDILALATSEITRDVKEKHGITVTIRTDAPRQQAGRCEPATPPERLPQPDQPETPRP